MLAVTVTSKVQQSQTRLCNLC